MTATFVETNQRHEPASGPGSAAGSLLSSLKRPWTKLANWLVDLERYRESTFELRFLTDRELDDIGIPRWQIPEIAWRSVADRRSADRD
jgi:uncharacterized protein YjiS (DUF1127 family)